MTSEKTRRFVVRVKRDKDRWLVGGVDGIPGVHTQAKSLAQLEERILDAITLYHDMEEHPKKAPKRPDSKGPASISRKFEGSFRIEVPA